MSDHQQHFGNLVRAPQICPSLHPPPPQRLPDPQHCCSLGGIVGCCPGVHTHRSWSHPHGLHPHSWSPAAPHGPFGTQRATEWLAWKRPQSPQSPKPCCGLSAPPPIAAPPMNGRTKPWTGWKSPARASLASQGETPEVKCSRLHALHWRSEQGRRGKGHTVGYF